MRFVPYVCALVALALPASANALDFTVRKEATLLRTTDGYGVHLNSTRPTLRELDVAYPSGQELKPGFSMKLELPFYAGDARHISFDPKLQADERDPVHRTKKCLVRLKFRYRY